jgi:uncharacterized repeat protein (TIGR01451 family)
MQMFKSLKIYFLAAVITLALPFAAWAWPTAADWIPIYYGSGELSDPQGDAQGNDGRDIVGDSSNAAAFLFNDGNYMYFRMRLNKDPRKVLATGELDPFGWGFLIDTDESLDDYEYMIMLDGISNPDVMYLAQNTVQGTLGDASDKAELILWQENLNYQNNYRILGPTDSGGPTTTFGGNGDYFLDYRIPYDVFKNSMGLEENSLIRYFVGSANNAMVLSADLVQGSDLYNGSSNFTLPSGSPPTTGSVFFVSDATGATDLTEFYAGATIYLKVIDADLNSIASQVQTTSVQVESPSGDLETVTLTETGADTGIFTGPLLTLDDPESDDDGVLQVSPTEIVTVTYIDAADGSTPTPLKNQGRTDTARALPAADLQVVKSVNDSTPNEGDTITYSVTVTNQGPSSASGIQITDLLPAGVTYVSHIAPGSTSYNPGTGLWSAGSLAKDAGKTLQINAVVDDGTAQTTIHNTATRTAAAQPDPNPANDSSTASISVTGADLSVAKSVNDLLPAVGETVEFTITVTNNGTFGATGVVLEDVLPTATWSSVSVDSASQGTTSYTGGTLTWNIGTLAYPAGGPGETATLVLSATLAGSVAGGTTVVNTAAIASVDQSDPDPADDSASVTLVVGGIDLSLDKSVTSPASATVDEGDTVVFSVTVTNSAVSSTTATGVEVTDLLPAGLSYDSYSATQGTFASGNGRWNGISLAPGASATLTLNATVDGGTAGRTLTNTAEITAYDQVDIDTGSHSAEAAVAVRSSDIQVQKTVDNPTPNDGDNINFTITATNVGSLDVTTLTVFDQLPGQVDYVSSTATHGSYSDSTHLWTVGPLTAGQAATLTITVTVNLSQQDPRTFFNTASLDSVLPGDSNSTNDVASAVVSVEGTDLGITKEMNTGYTNYPASGDTTQFLITLTNLGPNPATGIVVKDLLPSGLSCGSGTVSQGSFATNKCEWSVGNLAVDASATLVLTSTVSAANGTTLTNRASITAVDQPDPNAGNNTGSQILYIGASDLSLSKTADNATPNVGDMVTFTITLTNNGINSVGGIEVTDQLPAGLTLIETGIDAPSATQGSYDAGTGVWTVGTVGYPGSATLTLKGTVDEGTGGTTLTNQAGITAAGALDPDSSNDQASAAVDVQQADVYVNKEADSLTPYVGETVTFTITAGNNGPSSATNLIVNDLLPSAPDSQSTPDPVFSGISAIPSTGTFNPATGDWAIGALAKNATATLTITATVNSDTESLNITNTAAKASADQTDPNAFNDSASITLTPQLLLIDLQLTKGVNDAAPVEGSNVLFTLTLYNLHGSRAADAIQVTDLLAADFTFVSATPSQGSYDSGTGIWDVAFLGPMSNVTLSLTASTACGSAGSTLTNQAEITAADQNDPDAGNNSAGVDVTPIDASPSLMVVKSATHSITGDPLISAAPGQVITYTVQVQNTGCGKATNVELDDHMSPYTAWQLDFNNDGAPDEPFNFAAQTSGLTLGTPDYSQDNGGTWDVTPTSEGGGMPAGYDGTITNWQIPMTGEMASGGQFTLRYKVRVK